MMKVDIILPVYNGEKYLSECIESVLNQKYKNIKLIILDDCSNDNSANIVNSFNDSRIEFHNNFTNLGLFKSLNKLIELSTSDFFHIWSQDDLMEPDCIDLCVKYYIEFKFKMAYSAVNYVDGDGLKFKNEKLDETPTVISKELFKAISLFYGSITGNIANVCLSREAIKEFGNFDDKMIVSGDFEYWVRVGLNSEIIYINKPIVRLRRHAGQLSRQFKSAYLFMIEDDRIFDKIKLNIGNTHNKNIATKYISWKNYTHYFNVAIFLLYNFEFKLFVRCIKFINKKESVFLVFIKWILVRSFRLLGKEEFFFKRFINNYHV